MLRSKLSLIFTIVLSPIFWLVLIGAALVVYGSGCAGAPVVHPCIWVQALGQFDCQAADGTSFLLKPEDAKNLVCYPPEEDAAFLKYCRSK